MKRPKHPLRPSSLALAVLCCLLFLVIAPYLVSGRHLDLKGAAVFAASRDSYSLSSPVRLLGTPVVELESGTLSLPQSHGLARGGEMIAMLITGSGPRLTLDDATFTADFSTAEPTFLQTSAGSIAPLVASFQKLQFDALTIQNGSVRIKMADGSTLTLDDLAAEVTSKPTGTVRVAGSFSFRGEKVSFDTTLGPSAPTQPGARPITASLDSAMLSARLDGSLLFADNPRLLSQHAEVNIPHLRQAARWLGAGWPPGFGFDDFHAKGQLEWVNRTLAFQKAVLQMDGNEAEGTLSVNFAAARPAVDGTLGLKTLDLSKYLARGNAADQESGASLLTLVSGARGLEFPLIENVDADLRISSDSVVVPGLTIGHSAATVSLKGGKMLADIAELEIDDGTRGGGQLRIDTNGSHPSYDVHAKLESIDLGQAGKAIFGHPTVQGRGDVIVDLTADGDSGDTLLRSLDGKLCVTVDEGGQLGVDVNQLVTAAASSQQALLWRAAASTAIPIDRLDARFAVVNGVIRTETAQAMAGARAMKADGAIDLPGHSLDIELAIGDRARADAGEDVKPAPREVIDLRGPWVQPTLQPVAAPGTPNPEQQDTPAGPG
ncbi:MAG TPA: AsmA-like C-terminal region-containing protein [Hyphomicrobium sp.]|nr:AsmA-like C-terminal region-containing protein [Hyphomicrobium sp.]